MTLDTMASHSNPSGATLADGAARVTLVNDDSGNQSMFPDNSMANAFNGNELPLPMRTLRVAGTRMTKWSSRCCELSGDPDNQVNRARLGRLQLPATACDAVNASHLTVPLIFAPEAAVASTANVPPPPSGANRTLPDPVV